MNTARDLLNHLAEIGATIEPTGDRLRLRAGSQPVPVTIIRGLREVKSELLALLYREVAPTHPPRVVPFGDGEPSTEDPCAARRGRAVVLDNGAFLHFCQICGRFGAFGHGVHLTSGRLGRWYCREHRPQPRQRAE